MRMPPAEDGPATACSAATGSYSRMMMEKYGTDQLLREEVMETTELLYVSDIGGGKRVQRE